MSQLDLNNPQHARKFLRETPVGDAGVTIDMIQTKDGRSVAIEEATDEEAVEAAKDLAAQLKKGR